MMFGDGVSSEAGIFLERLAGMVIVFLLLVVNSSRSSAAC